MLKNYIKIALRTLLKGKLYTVINIFGLTLGITACMLVATVVLDELSYDRQWSHSKDLYRMVSFTGEGTDLARKVGAAYAGLAPQLKRSFPEVEEYGTLYVTPIHLKVDKGNEEPIKVNVLFADSAVRHLLDIDLIRYHDLDPAGDVTKIIISEKFQKTYFRNKDVLGKRIYDVPNYDAQANEYLIAGLMKDLPANTHLRADVILLQERKESALNKGDWGSYARHYIQVKPGTDPRRFEKKINQWYKDFVGKDKVTQFRLQPIADVYLKSSEIAAYQIIKGNIQHSYIFSCVAALLLLIACINFVNLSTARASSRLKETGVRKILGASRQRLILQFLLESVLTFGIALCITALCYQLYIPLVEKFIGHPLAVTLEAKWSYFGGVIVVILFVCLLTGLYPAWFISGFDVAGNVNGLLRTSSSKQGWLRKSLVVVQFAIAIIIIISLLVVQQQIHFLKNKDIGFDTQGLISINHVSWDNKFDVFKAELNKNPDILSFSLSSWLPTDGAGYMSRPVTDRRDPSKEAKIWYIAGSPNLAETLGLRLKKGRYLQNAWSADAIDADNLDAEINALRPCIMTASTAQFFQITDINQPLNDAKVMPVGIVEDFNSESLHKTIEHTVIVGYRNPQYSALLIRTRPGAEQKVMHAIGSAWNTTYREKLLDITPVKETLAAQYEAEEKLQKLFSGFSLLTMLLAALGVFGLIVHATNLRVKEIGIRKVLGASVSGIVSLLAKDFVKLVLLAIVVASPIAWWAMNKWLEDFAYRIDIQWWAFALAGLIAIMIGLITVSFQAIKAALANPVESLRSE